MKLRVGVIVFRVRFGLVVIRMFDNGVANILLKSFFGKVFERVFEFESLMKFSNLIVTNLLGFNW